MSCESTFSRTTIQQLMLVCFLSSKFFFPSVRVFAASEKIPFHLRLETSPVFMRSLAKLFLPQQDPSAIEDLLHVYVLRQTTVNVEGTSFTHEDVLGRGRMMLQSSSDSKVVLSESE